MMIESKIKVMEVMICKVSNNNSDNHNKNNECVNSILMIIIAKIMVIEIVKVMGAQKPASNNSWLYIVDDITTVDISTSILHDNMWCAVALNSHNCT